MTKTFTGYRRDSKSLMKNLLHPEKAVVTALDNVSFTIKHGEFVAYAGPNGAGKSTTMKLLAGMLLPGEGRITALGLSPKQDRIPLMTRMGVLFGNRTELWWDHPISQSFDWKRVVWDIPDAVFERNLDMVINLLDIGGLMSTCARELSLGQRMRADLAMMLLHGPELILLDEPTLGLDVVAKRQMIDFLKQINREDGVTILVTSHDMDDLEEMARRVLMISSGKLVYDGAFDGLRGLTHTRLSLTMAAHSRGAPGLPFSLLSSENDVYEYEVDLSATPIRELLGQLAALDGINDIELKKAPIEQVIAGLYRQWK